jgi:hypothetical protein
VLRKQISPLDEPEALQMKLTNESVFEPEALQMKLTNESV